MIVTASPEISRSTGRRPTHTLSARPKDRRLSTPAVADTINFAVGYLATDLAVLAEGDDVASNDLDENLDLLAEELDERGLNPYDVSDAVSTEALVMTSDRADELGITSLSDLD